MCSYPDRAPRNSTVSKGHVPFVQQKQCKPHVHFFSSCIKSKKMNLQPQGCLRRGVRASGPSQERTGESGAFGLWPHPRGSSRISS